MHNVYYEPKTGSCLGYGIMGHVNKGILILGYFGVEQKLSFQIFLSPMGTKIHLD